MKSPTNSKSQPSSSGVINSYLPIYLLTQTLGIGLISTLALWLTKHLGGFGFVTPQIVFNFHPLFMMIGFVFIFSNALLIYRTLSGRSHAQVKTLHSLLNVSAIVISGLGGMAAYYYHQKTGITKLYSLHSWLGIFTWTMFVSQHVTSVVTFVYPGAPSKVRAMVMPVHRFLGVATFVLATATTLTGLNQKAIYSFNGRDTNPNYNDLPQAGLLVNALGLGLVVYASLVVFLATKPQFQRSSHSHKE